MKITLQFIKLYVANFLQELYPMLLFVIPCILGAFCKHYTFLFYRRSFIRFCDLFNFLLFFFSPSVASTTILVILITKWEKFGDFTEPISFLLVSFSAFWIEICRFPKLVPALFALFDHVTEYHLDDALLNLWNEDLWKIRRVYVTKEVVGRHFASLAFKENLNHLQSLWIW